MDARVPRPWPPYGGGAPGRVSRRRHVHAPGARGQVAAGRRSPGLACGAWAGQLNRYRYDEVRPPASQNDPPTIPTMISTASALSIFSTSEDGGRGSRSRELTRSTYDNKEARGAACRGFTWPPIHLPRRRRRGGTVSRLSRSWHAQGRTGARDRPSPGPVWRRRRRSRRGLRGFRLSGGWVRPRRREEPFVAPLPTGTEALRARMTRVVVEADRPSVRLKVVESLLPFTRALAGRCSVAPVAVTTSPFPRHAPATVTPTAAGRLRGRGPGATPRHDVLGSAGGGCRARGRARSRMPASPRTPAVPGGHLTVINARGEARSA